MSKPSIWPVNGLRAPNSSVSAETPTIEPAAVLDRRHVRPRRQSPGRGQRLGSGA